MSRRAGAGSAQQDEPPVKPKDQAQNKQAILLAEDTGHFSLVKQVSFNHTSAQCLTAIQGNASGRCDY